MSANPVFVGGSGTITNFLIMYRHIRKIVKNDRFLYIPSKFYSRNSYILQGFSDFCLIPYYEEKVSNEDVIPYNIVNLRAFKICNTSTTTLSATIAYAEYK